jgi:hypothetical protein
MLYGNKNLQRGGKTGNIKVMGKKISKGVEKSMEVAKPPQ